MTESPHLSRRLRGRPTIAIAAAALLGIGGAAGAVAVAASRPSVTMAPATPVAIRSLSDGIVTIRGQVAERFGNKFVVADPTGRALVDTGPDGGDDGLVAVGQQVTVQGRFDEGFVHAAFLVGADGKVRALGPLGGGPRHGPHGPGRDGGPDGPPPPPPGGPDRRADGATPPPPPAPVPAAPVPAAQAGTAAPAAAGA